MNILRLALLATFALLCIPGHALGFLPQGKAPAAITGASHTLSNSDVPTSTQIHNNSDKVIRSYRIGWVYLVPGKADFGFGETVTLQNGIQPNNRAVTPSQRMPIKRAALNVLLFVAQVTFADGSSWTADTRQISKRLGR